MKDYSSIASINTSLKNNRNLRNQRREPFNKSDYDSKEKYPYSKSLHYKRVSKVKLERIKRQIQQQNANENGKLVFVLLSSILIAFGIIFFIVQIYNYNH